MNYIENFESIVKALYAAAPSEKARDFLTVLVEKIRSKGENWINENALKLYIGTHAKQCEDFSPISDNRLSYLARWQLVLADN